MQASEPFGVITVSDEGLVGACGTVSVIVSGFSLSGVPVKPMKD